MLKVALDFKIPAFLLDGKTPFMEGVVKDGKETQTGQPLMLNKLIANGLAMPTKKDKNEDLHKIMDWAQALYKGDKIELDKSDTEKLRTIIKEEFKLSRLIEWQIETIIDDAIEVAKAAKQ